MTKIITVLTALVISVMAIDIEDSDLRRKCTGQDMAHLEKKEANAEKRIIELESEKMHLEETIKIITKASDAKRTELKAKLEIVNSKLLEIYTWQESKYDQMTCRIMCSKS